ncbi:MAG: phage holin family protein [Eubacteriales bacterium]|nr:phage holin family protein [Clostridiales bacterium]MDD6720837.1 phage holin family protein [Clostridiales bacterium]MDY5694516.1 phage holin family protein [Eubacteriales bacterium]
MSEKAVMWIKGAIAALGGAAAYLWGPWDALINALIALVALDYVTGVICAAANKRLSSEIGFKGLIKKALIFALVAVAGVADKVIPATNQAIRAAVILFYIANEAISILENAAELGLPVPEKLKAVLIKTKGEDKAE